MNEYLFNSFFESIYKGSGKHRVSYLMCKRCGDCLCPLPYNLLQDAKDWPIASQHIERWHDESDVLMTALIGLNGNDEE